MASKKATEKPTRGTGSQDIVYAEDFAANTESLSVDTSVFRTDENAEDFDRIVKILKKGKFKVDSRTADKVIQFFDQEVDAIAPDAGDAIKAKNMFRAAFGTNFLGADGVPISHGGNGKVRKGRARGK